MVGYVPWFLPRLDDHTACDPWKQREFSEEEEKVDLEQSCSHCLADCEYTEYKVETTAAEFRFYSSSSSMSFIAEDFLVTVT